MKYLRINNISIPINFYQNRFINECARKIKAKIPEFHSFRVSQFQSFFVRCRRTYVLNKALTNLDMLLNRGVLEVCHKLLYFIIKKIKN